jgi:hypothetical protein
MTVTPAQLAHLAEQAEFAAGFFKSTNPSAADRFVQCAATARRMAEKIERREELNRIRSGLADVSKLIERRTGRVVSASRSAVDPDPVDVRTGVPGR